MKAIVLAAGKGVRLQPITATRPKHLIKLGGKPILEHCLNALKASGINEALIVIHYMGEKIRNYFGNGKDLGLKIEYAEQDAVKGTGHAISITEPYVKGEFLVVYGDLLFTNEAVKSVITLHRKEKPAMSMAVVPVKETEDYGIVELEKNNRVRRIVEKPRQGEAPSNLANAGIYVFTEVIFEKIKKTAASSRGEWEITDAISTLLRDEEPVLATQISADDWMDIGRPWDLLEANRWVLTKMKHEVCGLVEDGAHLLGPITVAENSRIRSGAYIEGPAFIDEKTDIGPNCYIRPYTSIGANVRVGNACEIKNSIIMDKTHVGHLSYVGDSILGENCNLGAGTITANYRLDAKTIKMMVKDKLMDSGRTKLGVMLGDNVKTGINTLFMPGVKVGVNTWIGPNVVVERDVPSNIVVLLHQSVEKKDLKF
jgi:bifunctional UDP-N-acetylglucosamine pyrophosphorylase/glucosamine-1-phosphate N-acetyltransferase